ncbi:MAG: tRNA pseudouridine(38-40) synthase TruA [Anaerolineae bacterium]
MNRYLGVLEYDGTDFCGSQIQPGQRSVQGEVEQALAALNGRETAVLFAGRTDAGVHASGQVIAIDLERDMSASELCKALNGLTPRDVSLRETVPVPPDFHPRFWADGRRYVYRILRREQRQALRDRYVWHLPTRLDVSAMQQAGATLEGRHDFGSFGRPPQGDNTWRTVRRLTVAQDGDEIAIAVEADAFLRRMVRIVVGTLVDVGRGRLTMSDVLALRDRGAGPAVGAAAPAKGLTLVAVAYERERLGYGMGSNLPYCGTGSNLPYWWSSEPLAGVG